jgi:methylmalonyl-CoA/ethylmalonyl-CoA epimerase
MATIKAQAPSEFQTIGLPAADQIGFVVRDLQQAIALYDPLFGPFRIVDVGDYRCSYRGQPHSHYKANFAFGQIGDLEIELIEYISGDTPHRDFLERGQEGMHHLRFRVAPVEQWISKLETLGYRTAWYNRASPDLAFAYLDREGDPLTIELLEANFNPG